MKIEDFELTENKTKDLWYTRGGKELLKVRFVEHLGPCLKKRKSFTFHQSEGDVFLEVFDLEQVHPTYRDALMALLPQGSKGGRQC